MNGGNHPRGCAGAVWSSGAPSSSYCNVTGTSGTRIKNTTHGNYYQDCCTSDRRPMSDNATAKEREGKEKLQIKIKTADKSHAQTSDPLYVEFYKGNKQTKIGSKEILVNSISRNSEAVKDFYIDAKSTDHILVKLITDSNDGTNIDKFETTYNNKTYTYTEVSNTAVFTAPAPDNTVGKMDKNGVVIPSRWFTEINEPASEICKRKVTAKRKDSGGGWGMNLSFKCGDTEVSIGNSGNNSKTSADSYNLSSNACPTRR